MKFRKLYLAVLSLLIGMSFNISYAQPNLDTPANNTLNYNFTKVTYTWDTVGNATSYDLQVSNDSSSSATYVKTYSGLDTNAYTPPSDYLSYNTQYFWRVRAKVNGVSTDYSDYFAFTTGTPSNSIGVNANASITFDHTTGRITQITYINGSNKQILDTTQNNLNRYGLGRINNETGTYLASWTENPGIYVYNYVNASYGSKTLTITWNALGVVVDISININAGRSAVLNAAWQPGGDLGPLHDYVLYAANSNLLTKTNLTYPGLASIIYSGGTILTAMTDDRYPEYFGFKTSAPVQTFIQQSITFGPEYTFPSSTTAQTVDLTFAVMSKSNYFTWSGNKYIIAYTPTAASNLLDQSSPVVNWETFGISSNISIGLSINGGKTIDTLMASGVADNGSHTVTLPYLKASVPLDSCLVQVSGGGVFANSGIFSIVSNTSNVFSIPANLTGAPSDTVTVPVVITPAAGDSIYAFDLRLFYNKIVLTYARSITNAALTNWNVGVTNNSSGYIQIGGFNNTGSAVAAKDTLVTLKFAISSTALVGSQNPLTINNSYLSCANLSAQSLPVSGVDGLVTLYTRTSGFLRYILSKKPITGSIMLAYIDTVAGDTSYGSTDNSGYFNFSNQLPGGNIKLVPIENLSYPAQITNAVSAVDAAKTFAGRDGGPTPLSPLQDVVADVNGDGKINSTDAYAILKISTGALTEASFGLSNWVFIDSSYTLTVTNWASAPQNKCYFPLDSITSHQSFWGAIRGDVTGSYVLPANVDKASSVFDGTAGTNAVEFSVPQNMNVRPGDTLLLPLDIKLNGNAVGAFNISLQLDKNLVSYSGNYIESSSIPPNKGWTFSTYFDQAGKFNIGAADFSDTLAPIVNDGPIAIFKFVVNNKAVIGDTSQVLLCGLTIADSKLNKLTAGSTNGKVTISNVTAAGENNIIYEYSLAQNYPNPFNPSTTIQYSLKQKSNVELVIYNIIGQRVATLFNGSQPAGSYKLIWNAQSLASGIYFYKIKAGEFSQVKKMILLK
jgi:hypothetical protein